MSRSPQTTPHGSLFSFAYRRLVRRLCGSEFAMQERNWKEVVRVNAELAAERDVLRRVVVEAWRIAAETRVRRATYDSPERLAQAVGELDDFYASKGFTRCQPVDVNAAFEDHLDRSQWLEKRTKRDFG